MKKLYTFLTICLLAAGPLAAGVVFEVETTDHEQDPPEVDMTEVSAEGKNLKMSIKGGTDRQDGEMIFRGDRREMVVVDHDDKSYMVLDQEAMGAISGQVNSAMRQMQEALENIPEDQREMVERMMKERMPQMDQAAASRGPKRDIRKTSQRGQQAGYPCVKYEVIQDGRKVRELWVTDWSNVEGGTEVSETFEDMAEFFEEMMDSFTGPLGDAVGSGFGRDNFFESLKDLPGFPVVTKEFNDDGSLEGEATLRSARRRTLDPDAFEPPAGYKRQTMGPQ